MSFDWWKSEIKLERKRGKCLKKTTIHSTQLYLQLPIYSTTLIIQTKKKNLERTRHFLFLFHISSFLKFIYFIFCELTIKSNKKLAKENKEFWESSLSGWPNVAINYWLFFQMFELSFFFDSPRISHPVFTTVFPRKLVTWLEFNLSCWKSIGPQHWMTFPWTNSKIDRALFEAKRRRKKSPAKWE